MAPASVRGDRSSKISHALYHDADHRRDRRDPGGAFADRSRRRTGEYRHLVRVRNRLPRRSRFADHPSIHRPFKTPAVFAVAPRQVDVVAVVKEINGDADDEPDGKPQPGIAR
jgi:hypothetical protein